MPNTPLVQSRTPKGAFDARVFLGQPDVGKSVEKYEKNQKIFSQGDDADTVYFIQKGKVKITVLSEHGKEAVVGILAEGQFFGESCLDGAQLRTATSHAMEECLITSISKSAMPNAYAPPTSDGQCAPLHTRSNPDSRMMAAQTVLISRRSGVNWIRSPTTYQMNPYSRTAPTT